MENTIDYKIGDKTRSGYKIGTIFGQSKCFLVAFDNQGALVWETNNVSKLQELVAAEAVKIHSELENMIPTGIDAQTNFSTRELLAKQLFFAMNLSNVEEVENSFEKAKKTIKFLLTPNQGKLILISCCTMITFIVSTISFSVAFFMGLGSNELLLCLGSGATGSLFSLLSRNSSVEVNLQDGKIYIVIQAFTITLTGLISGLILFSFANSDLAFSFAKDNIYNLIVLSIIAGFSERFIPDLFAKTTTQNNS